MSERDNATSVEAEWEREIDARVKDIEEGRVELVSTMPHRVSLVLL
ncbi:MAG: hypothetical protein JWR15_4379 [Prosthecobacter sp.]|nr:hypothetical protein [Prosthecobacter sp.]